jgi:hypothetical protein
MKHAVSILLVGALILVPLAGPSLAQDSWQQDSPSGAAMMADLLFRPLGLVSLVAGSALFVVALPFTATGGNIHESYEALIVEPARMTFARPLGQDP